MTPLISNGTLNAMAAADDGSVTFTPPSDTFSKYRVISLVKPLPSMMGHLKHKPVLLDRDKYLEMPKSLGKTKQANSSTGITGNSFIPGQQESDYAHIVKTKTLQIPRGEQTDPPKQSISSGAAA